MSRPVTDGGTGDAAKLLTSVENDLDRVFTSLEPLADLYTDLVVSTEVVATHDLSVLRPVIFQVLERHRGLIGGAGVVVSPGVLTDNSHWLEWWWTGINGRPEPLRVDPDPAAPDFFDYLTADWYATPLRTGRRRIAGPYVDYVCTNEYAVTLSAPVTAGGRLIGVAAADVLVSSVEKLVLPALVNIDHPVALTSGDGRIIAANHPDWLPGDRVRSAGSRTGEAEPWKLVDLRTAARHGRTRTTDDSR